MYKLNIESSSTKIILQNGLYMKKNILRFGCLMEQILLHSENAPSQADESKKPFPKEKAEEKN